MWEHLETLFLLSWCHWQLLTVVSMTLSFTWNHFLIGNAKCRHLIVDWLSWGLFCDFSCLTAMLMDSFASEIMTSMRFKWFLIEMVILGLNIHVMMMSFIEYLMKWRLCLVRDEMRSGIWLNLLKIWGFISFFPNFNSQTISAR